MKKFIKQNQKPIGAFLFFILLTSISAFVYFNTENTANIQKTESNQNSTKDIDSSVVPIPQVMDDNLDPSMPQDDTRTIPQDDKQKDEPAIITENRETYYITVDGEKYNLSLSNKQELTVYELMQFLTADSKKPFFFQTKEFAGIGHFVESINGIKNNQKENQYWIYYINGESANMGISQYKIQPNDKIEWRFEESTL